MLNESGGGRCCAVADDQGALYRQEMSPPEPDKPAAEPPEPLVPPMPCAFHVDALKPQAGPPHETLTDPKWADFLKRMDERQHKPRRRRR